MSTPDVNMTQARPYNPNAAAPAAPQRSLVAEVGSNAAREAGRSAAAQPTGPLAGRGSEENVKMGDAEVAEVQTRCLALLQGNPEGVNAWLESRAFLTKEQAMGVFFNAITVGNCQIIRKAMNILKKTLTNEQLTEFLARCYVNMQNVEDASIKGVYLDDKKMLCMLVNFFGHLATFTSKKDEIFRTIVESSGIDEAAIKERAKTIKI